MIIDFLQYSWVLIYEIYVVESTKPVSNCYVFGNIHVSNVDAIYRWLWRWCNGHKPANNNRMWYQFCFNRYCCQWLCIGWRNGLVPNRGRLWPESMKTKFMGTSKPHCSDHTTGYDCMNLAIGGFSVAILCLHFFFQIMPVTKIMSQDITWAKASALSSIRAQCPSTSV